MVTHFATLEIFSKENNTDYKRVCTLDKCGATTGIDVDGKLGSKGFLCKDGGRDIKVASFPNFEMATMMAAVSASENAPDVLKKSTSPHAQFLMKEEEGSKRQLTSYLVRPCFVSGRKVGESTCPCFDLGQAFC